ncbi:hypothetical protein N7499_006278 [Penicillium canescens]|nr:hypothetical protein N7499_006278 [Penicillium canescens]KAJ6176799.1 hypothetical protein N7485_003713 [Penicillium canescens]
MSSQQKIFLGTPFPQSMDADTIIAKIYNEFTIVQHHCYQKDGMLRAYERAYEKQNLELNAQLCSMCRYIEELEQKNRKLNEKMSGMEPGRTSIEQASSDQGKGSQG